MRAIALASKMKKFTSEICLHQDDKFDAIDDINAEPDMSPRSHYSNRVPDEVVGYVVWLLFHETMHTVKRGHGFFDVRLCYLDRAQYNRARVGARVEGSIPIGSGMGGKLPFAAEATRFY